MSNSIPLPGSPDDDLDPHFLNALRQLGKAVDDLKADTPYILRALTEMLRALRPVSVEGSARKQRMRYLIETGVYTAEELGATVTAVDRGALQLRVAETWLSQLCTTMSLEETTGYLGWSEEAVQAAVSEGRLYGVDISGRLRFPAFQFNVASAAKLIPGLTDIIEAVTPRWDWRSVAGFMATPQSSLIAEGRKTPVEWLRDGGDVNDVKKIIEASDWR